MYIQSELIEKTELPGFEVEVLFQQRNSFSDRLKFLISKYFEQLIFVILAIQVLKGTAVYQGPYARAHYLWSYDEGLIKRGLLGSIAMYLSDGVEYRMLGIINFLSYLIFFTFLILLYRFIITNAKSVFEKFVAICFVSSPAVLGMGSLLGYLDALLMIVLLVGCQYSNKRKISKIACFLLIIFSLLVHELAIIFVVLPVCCMIWLNRHETIKNKLILIGGNLFLSGLYFVFMSVKNAPFESLLNLRLVNYASELSTKSGPAYFIKYGNYAIKNNFAKDFDISRLSMLEVCYPIYGLFISIIAVIGAVKLLRHRQALSAGIFFAACHLPLMILVVAWDVERFICLTGCMAYFMYSSVSFLPIPVMKRFSNGWLYLCLLVFNVMSLLTYYPIAEFYAEGETVLSAKKQEVLIQLPKKIIVKWFSR